MMEVFILILHTLFSRTYFFFEMTKQKHNNKYYLAVFRQVRDITEF